MENLNYENPFENSSVDPIVGSTIMRSLGLTTMDIQSPDKFNKLNDILKYVGNRQGGDYLINRIVATKPNIDRLNTAWEYINLRSKHDGLKNEMEKLTKELELYER